MNEFSKWMAQVEAVENYPIDAILHSIAYLKLQRDQIMLEFGDTSNDMKELKERLLLVHAKIRYFELKLEAVKG